MSQALSGQAINVANRQDKLRALIGHASSQKQVNQVGGMDK